MTKKKTAPAARLDRDWLTSKEACSYLGISFPLLKQYIAEGKLVGVQIIPRGKIRISASSIEKLLESSRIKPTSRHKVA